MMHQKYIKSQHDQGNFENCFKILCRSYIVRDKYIPQDFEGSSILDSVFFLDWTMSKDTHHQRAQAAKASK